MTDSEWPLWSAEHPVPDPTVAPAAPPVRPGATGAGGPAAATCPQCGLPIDPAAWFCEACGNPLVPTAPVPTHAVPPMLTAPDAPSTQTRRLGVRVSQIHSCPSCGGTVSSDGYCQTCGAKAPSVRDHFTAAPAPWVGGVCDRGIKHHRNEDAMALWAQGDRAVLVVCDGVSTSVDSDVAALAAAEKAREVLVALTSDGVAGSDTLDTATARALVTAATEANQAVIATTDPLSTNAASATFAAAVVSGAQVHYATLGDSRVYFLGGTQRLQLSVDDSMAQAFIAEGMPRAEAEALPRGHAITKWLGRDAGDIEPRTGVHELTQDGWLVVCSDGLWNYASTADDLGTQVDAAAADSPEPVVVAQRLVDWANAQGGHDNVTVALAWCRVRLESAPATQPRKELPEHG